MKIIDLLNKIANNEEVPKKICYEEYIWTWNGETYDNREQCLFEDYIDKKYVITDVLNDEIEIIEEKPKKIEKLSVKTNNHNVRKVANKINEIIDYLLEKESDK